MIQENVVHLILFFNSIKYEDTFTQKTISIKSLHANIKEKCYYTHLLSLIFLKNSHIL